jgi:DnaK suppressor protein
MITAKSATRQNRVIRQRRVAELRRWLIAERQRLLEDFEQSRSASWMSAAGPDHLDQAGAEQDLGTALQILTDESDALARVESALAKMEDGTYGVCEECGRPIALARLSALPVALLCRRCKEAEERDGAPGPLTGSVRVHATPSDLKEFWADDSPGTNRYVRLDPAFRAA